MTARELLFKQLADAENQVLQAIAGLDAKHAETKATEGGMTIREGVQHLAEAAVATLASYETSQLRGPRARMGLLRSRGSLVARR